MFYLSVSFVMGKFLSLARQREREREWHEFYRLLHTPMCYLCYIMCVCSLFFFPIFRENILTDWWVVKILSTNKFEICGASISVLHMLFYHMKRNWNKLVIFFCKRMTLQKFISRKIFLEINDTFAKLEI